MLLYKNSSGALPTQIVYVRELASRLERSGVPVLVHAVHPGVTAAGIQRRVQFEGEIFQLKCP